MGLLVRVVACQSGKEESNSVELIQNCFLKSPQETIQAEDI